MTRRAFALLPVLWTVVLLGTLVLASSEEAALALRAARNRILEREAWWAGQACIAVVESRIRHHAVSPDGRVPSGLQVGLTFDDGRSCESQLHDNGATLNVNLADTAVLECAVGPVAARAITRYRPLPNEDAIALLVKEMSRVDLRSLRVRGDNQMNINSAAPEVLACLPEAGPSVRAAVESARRGGRRFSSLDELAVAMGSISGRRFLEAFATSATGLLVDAPSWDVRVIGRAGAPPVASEMILRVAVRGQDTDVLAVEVP